MCQCLVFIFKICLHGLEWNFVHKKKKVGHQWNKKRGSSLLTECKMVTYLVIHLGKLIIQSTDSVRLNDTSDWLHYQYIFTICLCLLHVVFQFYKL